MLTQDQTEQVVKILYTNYKVYKAMRRILPERIWFAQTERNPKKQCFLYAEDPDKKILRSFTFHDIRSLFLNSFMYLCDRDIQVFL